MNRLGVVVLFGIVAALAVIGRAFQIQIIGDPRLARLSSQQFKTQILLQPKRGAILDREGRSLAINAKTSSIAINPQQVKNSARLTLSLARLTGLPAREIQKKLTSDRSFVWLARDVSESSAVAIRDWKIRHSARDTDTSAVFLVQENKRVYPQNRSAAHLIGSVNRDTVGIEGVELWQNEVLQGQDSSFTGQKDALGRPTLIETEAAQEVQDGQDVRLTIDLPLQYEVEGALQQSLNETGAVSGSVLVLDAARGEWLAVANLPSFNPNLRDAPASERRNRAFTDGYEPGSVVKPVLLAGALMRRFKLTDTLWGGNGSMEIQGRTISEAEAHEKFEWISLKKMIQVSSNVGAARLALKLGSDKVLASYSLFGLGSKTGTQFPGELGGWLPRGSKIQPLTVANLGFGHGLFVTLAQIARAYGAFANKGVLVEPRLLLSDADPITHQIVSASVAHQVTASLLDATSPEGTGHRAVLEGYRIAGKTGTAQTVDPVTKKYSRDRYISTFVGFAPLSVRPIVIAVSVDRPRGVYYASDTAAPLFREVFKAVAHHFDIPPTEPLTPLADKTQDPTPTATVDEQPPILSTAAAPLMPRLVGLSPREALAEFEGRSVRLKMEGFGLVVSQSPLPGEALNPGARVVLKLGTSAPSSVPADHSLEN